MADTVLDQQQNQPQDQNLTTPVYDISGAQPVLGDIPHEQIQDAISSGKYSFPKGQQINVVSPNGTFGTVPADQAPQAFQNGFQYATPTMLSAQQDKEQYGTTAQQSIGMLEQAAKGFAGPLAPMAERALGISPEGIEKRQEMLQQEHPWASGLSEAAGFGAGMLTGTGEAALLEHAVAPVGEAVTKAITGGVAQSAIQNVGARMAAGAAKLAVEMGLFQAGDEASKAIQNASDTVGQAAANIGMSALLGGIFGAPLAGIGMAGKSAINSQLLKDFSDRLAFRGANVNPNELMEKEFNDAISTYHGMNDELLGPTGLKAQALSELMPKASPEIYRQAQEVADSIQNKIDYMRSKPNSFPERLITKLEGDLSEYKQKALPEVSEVPYQPVESALNYGKPAEQTIYSTIDPYAEINVPISSVSPSIEKAGKTTFQQPFVSSKQKPVGQVFDAINSLKQTIQGYSKGNYGPFAIPAHHEAYDFLNVAKSLGHDLKNNLEDQDTWGKVADLQKNLNKSWTDVLPAVKDAQSKFMEKVGGEYVPSPQKFLTYTNTNGKATTETIRQKMMGNFVDSLSNHFDQIDKIYDHAGVENPYPKVSMNALQESLNRPSVGSKLADLWYTRLGPTGLGEALGGATGFGIGHATGIPEAGFGGAYLGKWVLGPAFSAVIKPLMEKGASMPAFRQSMAYMQSALKGNDALTKSAANLFAAGSKTIPSHFMPSSDQTKKLSKQLEEAQANPQKMLNVAGDMGTYLPDHAQALSQGAMTAVTYLNSLRPNQPKACPLDTDLPPSKSKTATFDRALEIAEQPLVAIQHAKDGTLLPEDVQTIKTIYPGFYNKMSQEIMNSMGDHISKGETVPYRLKQSLSLFLGQPLDSTMTPQAIMSIQGMYAQNQAQKNIPPQTKTKKNTSKLGEISKDHYTQAQAASARATQWD